MKNQLPFLPLIVAYIKSEGVHGTGNRDSCAEVLHPGAAPMGVADGFHRRRLPLRAVLVADPCCFLSREGNRNQLFFTRLEYNM